MSTQKSDAQTIRAMLNDVEAVTKSRFYEDPDPIASPVEMFLVQDGSERGEPFEALSTREKVQVLGDYTDWQKYQERGVTFEQMDQVFWNVVQGKPRGQWLEGSGLDKPLPDGKTDLQKEQETAMELLLQVLREQQSTGTGLTQTEPLHPATEGLVRALMMDARPNDNAIVDFGVESQQHYEALALPLRAGEITPEELDAARGDGKALTLLARTAASNPHDKIKFDLPWHRLLRERIPAERKAARARDMGMER